MKGVTLVFTKQTTGTNKDKFGNLIPVTTTVSVDDCLIAPIIEPTTAREEQAIQQGKIQVRIHLPKASDADVSDSTVEWGGKKFHLDSDSVVFMNENCPTRWNRYFRAEAVYE